MGATPAAVLPAAVPPDDGAPAHRHGTPDDGALARFVRDATRTAVTTRGHHNRNFIVPLDKPMARFLGRCAGERVTVRRRMRGVLQVVIRTWEDERLVLDTLKGVLPHVPECLAVVGDTAVHSYVEGVPLSSVCEYGKPVDPRLVEAFAGLLAQTVRVRRENLPELPYGWPKDGDSEAFLRTLARLADQQIRQPNWTEFGELFMALGVPEDALRRFADRIPRMAARPFGLLHTDLHRDNVIIPYYGDSGPPLVCVDWELATYGDPLHDLATHLVRMRYPDVQEQEVVDAWCRAVGEIRPDVVNGVEDLGHYIAFEQAQSVYPDVMRAVNRLDGTDLPRDLAQAADSVQRALQAAQEPLQLGELPSLPAIEQVIHRWHMTARSGRHARGRSRQSAVLWQADVQVPERPGFPWTAVTEALAAEAAAPAERVFKGTHHINTIVDVASAGASVVVRRRASGPRRAEPCVLDEHKVLLALEQLPVGAVRAPRILALGYKGLSDRFAIHSYEGPGDYFQPPDHPVSGLLPHEADDLVDQLAALVHIDTGPLDDAVSSDTFYRLLSDRLVELVRGLPKESLQLARVLGLPAADRLKEMLDSRTVTPRTPVLLHGDLNPWNLVRGSRSGPLTIIDWEMAMIGDPLYDLVRHLHLTRHRSEIGRRMFRRWERSLPPDYVKGWEEDRRTYRWIELVRSAYIDLDRLVTGVGLDAPNVRKAVDSYAVTLYAATASLGLRGGRVVNPYLIAALPEGDRVIPGAKPRAESPVTSSAR
ncbi:phosphotransferase [Streptomyces sp. NPDC001970]